jgi:predicted permease
MSALAVFAALAPVFLLIMTGVGLKRWLVTRDEHWAGAEQVVYYVLFPALLIVTLARADLSRVPVVQVAGATLGAVLVMTAICLALRPLLAAALGIGGAAFTSVFQGATRWQTYIGLAVAQHLFGDDGLALASVAAAAMIPLLNVTAVWVLARYASSAPPPWRRVLIAIVKNPLIWSCVIGIALNVSGLSIPGVLNAYGDALARASLSMGLLLVGAGLQVRSLLRPAPATFVAAALKLIVMPAIAMTLAHLLGATGAPLAVIVICTAVPAASSAYVLARQMGGDTALVAEILTFETIAAAVTMPLAIEFAMR